jgi:hypothetical protein
MTTDVRTKPTCNVVNLSGPPKADDQRPRMTVAEWHAEGCRRFGEDMLTWRFACPACGHVQTINDFKPFKDRGATPDSVRKECLGRYLDVRYKAFGENPPRTPTSPCDYAAYGLFRLAPLIVVEDSGLLCECFGFAE